jgi:FkbM family methyltransferase
MSIPTPGRPAAFVLVSTNHGTMIVNRNDYRMVGENAGYGVGFQLMNTSSYDQAEVTLTLDLLRARRANYGDPVVAIDCGANVGVYSLEWGRLMRGWGSVYAFEPQEKIYYALAGNVALNNCFNVTARLAAIGAHCGELAVPQVDYCVPSSFGSLELMEADTNEYIGQNIDYSRPAQCVDLLSIDSLQLPRIDLLKIDVEAMELEVLEGARESIQRCHPEIVVEVIKSDEKAVSKLLEAAGYQCFPMGMNILAVHASDPILGCLASGRPIGGGAHA